MPFSNEYCHHGRSEGGRVGEWEGGREGGREEKPAEATLALWDSCAHPAGGLGRSHYGFFPSSKHVSPSFPPSLGHGRQVGRIWDPARARTCECPTVSACLR